MAREEDEEAQALGTEEAAGESSHPRLRSGLRRHGLVPRPEPIRLVVPAPGLRFTGGNRVTLFETGPEGLAAQLDAIERARRRVHLETYILRGDVTGRRFVEALAERARSGVAVRLLFDAFGSLGLGEEVLAPLRRAGGEVVAFNPWRRFYPRWAPRRRDHRKLLVVDGEVAFTGGLNLGDEYARAPAAARGSWADAHLRLEGPAVRELEAVFLESWFRADGPELAWSELLGRAPEPRGGVRCAVVPDGPVYRRRALRELLVSALATARERVCIWSPYFAPGRRVLESLAQAARRGVAVGLVLAGDHSDHPTLRRAAHAIFPRLLAAGVRVYEYEEAMMHAKAAVFDGAWAIVGTSNLDRQSLEHSYEVNVVVEGGAVPARLVERFTRDTGRSRRIDSARLAARGPLERLLDRLAALLLRLI